MQSEHDLHMTEARAVLLGPCRRLSRSFAQVLPIGALLALGLGLAACGGGGGSASTQPTPDGALRDEGRTLFGRSGPARGEDAAGGNWTIVLAAFRGDDRAAQAAATLTEVRTILGAPTAFVEDRGSNVVVAVGAFPDPASAAARGELERIRSIQFRGDLPFAGAFLAPPYAVTVGSRSEYNLLTAKQTHGRDALYSLQIGAYGAKNMWDPPTEADLRQARQAAEEAAATLRREGELAFYYHGPNRSMVTVGVFDLSDFDPQTPGYQSRRLMDTRKRFPHNLYNGAGVRETRRGRPPQIHASTLVAIPER